MRSTTSILRRAAIALGLLVTSIAALVAAPSTAHAAPSGTVRIEPVHSQKCVAAVSATQVGGGVEQQTCVGNKTTQFWRFQVDNFGNVQIVNSANQRCVEPQASAPGSRVLLQPCSNAANGQFWREEQRRVNGNIVSRWRNLSTGLYLDVSGASQADGAPVIVFSLTGGNNQLFDHIVVSP